ncbi:hypothetical protein V5799_013768 [Amblyomma americanum]|uniref:CHHC U11-48K-type domain-containing protein n=1 Tax=Amblyomma americanum TaxID=6943 RepID=A0AAQ4E520_AMBAM
MVEKWSWIGLTAKCCCSRDCLCKLVAFCSGKSLSPVLRETMATYTERRDPLVTCPFNPAHRVRKGRLQIHITKCRKAYAEKNMKHCPFSAEHVVPASELMHHIDTCPLNTTVEHFLTASEGYGPSGFTTVPPPTYQEVTAEENWDEEAAGSASLQDKIRTPAVAPVFINVQTMTPAERRHYYASLHSVA